MSGRLGLVMPLLKRVIELVGPKGCGKSSVLQQLARHCATDGPVLLIDASSDLQLSRGVFPNLAESDLLGPSLEKLQGTVSFTNATHDHLLSDQFFTELSRPMAPDVDVLSVGALPKQFSSSASTVFNYGFPRLLRQYAYVLVDGYHEGIHVMLPTENYFPLIVVSPAFAEVLPKLSIFQTSVVTPFLILNQWGEEPLPEVIDTMIQAEQVHFAGKIPKFDTLVMPSDPFRQACDNCMMRLDIPYSR
jgi:energy-coupling factor transporter ATP-binding protein EcfA2